MAFPIEESTIFDLLISVNIQANLTMKVNKIIYWVSTLVLTLIMLMSISMYILRHQDVQAFYTNMGYPTYIIYPLALAKALGLVAVWIRRSRSLTEWAYAGFFFDTVLAFFAHIMVSDGAQYTALVAFIAVIGSYYAYRKLYT